MGGNFPGTDEGSGKDIEIESQKKAEAVANDAFVKSLDHAAAGPSERPKAYRTKLFGKLTEAEKWELQ